MPIDGAELTVLVGPFVPDAHAMLLQPAHVGVAAKEPQQLIDDRLEVDLLGREQGKTVGKVAAQLVAEHAARARARAVAFLMAVVKDILQ